MQTVVLPLYFNLGSLCGLLLQLLFKLQSDAKMPDIYALSKRNDKT
jgi:hypothetical protein